MRYLRLIAPGIAFVAAFFLLQGFGQQKALVGAVFATAVVLWISELMPLAVTALLSTAALVLVGGIKEKEAFAAYGDAIIPLFIGSFILAKAMELTGLSERFAHLILSRPWASKGPGRLVFTLSAVACILSLMVSNTAVTAMLLPVGLSVLSGIDRKKNSPYAIAALLTLTWGSSVAVGVPVGTPPNLIGIAQIRAATEASGNPVNISFAQWMVFAMPITILVLIAAWGILMAMYGRKDRPDTRHACIHSREVLNEMGPMKSGERVVLFAFVVALVCWILPDMCEVILGKTDALTKALQTRLTPTVTPIIAAALLFVIPTRDRPEGRAITWREATTIDWGTILLFGGGIALGQAMFSTGLAKDLGEVAARASGASTVWEITALSIIAAIVLSELASNTAAATTLVPVSIGLAQAAHVSPIPPALGAAIGASFGFMLPVSTAPNAIVYSSGLVPSKDMLKAGLILDIVSFFAIFLCLRLILPLMGLA
jgi:sodium-dependent dicarboxylate transporter 2/3/5